MTPIEERVRAAIHDTAREIPPGALPPLALPQPRARWSWPPPWRGWAVIPLAVVCLVAAVVVVAVNVLPAPTTGFQPKNIAGPTQPPTRSQTSSTGVPAYYVALTSANGKTPGIVAQPTTATVRATATGQVLATIAVPRSYYAFTAVTTAADDRTFVLVAESQKTTDKNTDVPGDAVALSRFYLLHLDPAARTAADRIRLQALPASYIPAGSTVQSLALSADGTTLAAIIGPLVGNEMYVFHLAARTEHIWSYSPCAQKCIPGGIASGSGVLSWAADSRTLAFVFYGRGGSEGQARLLDTVAPGTNLVADSKVAVNAPYGPYPYWSQAVITPDGRTVLAVRELVGTGQPTRQQLVRFSAATGQLTAVLNQLALGISNSERIQWTDSSGRELVISGTRNGSGAEILKGGQATPIPWSSQIFAAAW